MASRLSKLRKAQKKQVTNNVVPKSLEKLRANQSYAARQSDASRVAGLKSISARDADFRASNPGKLSKQQVSRAVGGGEGGQSLQRDAMQRRRINMLNIPTPDVQQEQPGAVKTISEKQALFGQVTGGEPRPTVPTKESPVGMIKAPTAPTLGESDMGGLGAADQLALMQRKLKERGGRLSDDEFLQLRNLQRQATEEQAQQMFQTPDMISDRVGQLEASKSQFQDPDGRYGGLTAQQHSNIIANKKERGLDREYVGRQEVQAAEAAKKRSQETLSRMGVGRSTYAAERADEIDTQLSRTLDRRRELSDIAMLREQAAGMGRNEEALNQINSQMSALYNEQVAAEQQATASAQKYIAENNIKGEDAINTFVDSLSSANPGLARKTNTFLSEQLGYLVDEFGNPTVTGGDGQPVKVQDDTRYSLYQKTDPYTGEMTTFFYDPKNPSKRFDDGQSRFPTSQTQNIDGVTVVGSSDERFADNCVFYAREQMGLPYTGGDGKEAKQNTIKKYGSTDIGGANVGDAIFTNEGEYGHAAVITDIDTGTGMITLSEANRFNDDSGKGVITEGRQISMDDPMVMGYVPNMKGKAGESQNFRTQDEGNNQPVQVTEETQDPSASFNWSLAEHARASKNGGMPQFRGRSQQEKDKQEALFRKENNKFIELKGRGDVQLKDYDPDKYRTVIAQAGNSINAKATTAAYKIQNALKKYRDSVEEYGAVEFNNPVVNQRYGDLQIAWKELANLGVLAGPDMGIIEDVIPPINTFVAPLKAALPGDRQQQILDAIDDQSNTISANAVRNVDILKSTYPDLSTDDLMKQFEAEARVTVSQLNNSSKNDVKSAQEQFKGQQASPNEVKMVSPDGKALFVPSENVGIFLKNEYKRVD